jgi:hypothetical protein
MPLAGVGWFGVGSFGVGWSGVGPLGSFGVGWFGVGWFGVGWFGVGWFGVGPGPAAEGPEKPLTVWSLLRASGFWVWKICPQLLTLNWKSRRRRARCETT